MKSQIRHTIKRDNGRVIVLVAENFSSPFTTGTPGENIAFFALVYSNLASRPILVQGCPGNMGDMTVEDYKNSPQRGIFSVVTYAEIIRATLDILG